MDSRGATESIDAAKRNVSTARKWVTSSTDSLARVRKRLEEILVEVKQCERQVSEAKDNLKEARQHLKDMEQRHEVIDVDADEVIDVDAAGDDDESTQTQQQQTKKQRLTHAGETPIASFLDVRCNNRKRRWDDSALLLANRCVVNYGWGWNMALRVLVAYREFLALKREAKDWGDESLGDDDDVIKTSLLPSRPVEMMWQQHVLDNEEYSEDMTRLCGRTLTYKPVWDGLFGAEREKERKYQATLNLLKRRFSNADEEIWCPFDDNKPDLFSNPAAFEFVVTTKEGDELMLSLRSKCSGEKDLLLCKVNGQTRISELERALATKLGIATLESRFVLDGEKINNDSTLDDNDFGEVGECIPVHPVATQLIDIFRARAFIAMPNWSNSASNLH